MYSVASLLNTSMRLPKLLGLENHKRKLKRNCEQATNGGRLAAPGTAAPLCGGRGSGPSPWIVAVCSRIPSPYAKEACLLLFRENKEYWFLRLWRRVAHVCRFRGPERQPAGGSCLPRRHLAGKAMKERKEGGTEEGEAGRVGRRL